MKLPSVTVGDQMYSWVEQELYTDCIMKVKFKDSENFKVNIIIIDPVFRKMFEIDMIERKSGEIEITDVDPHIMELTVKHLYGCKLAEGLLTREDIRDLFIAADKYDIVTLTKDCIEFTTKYLLIIPNNILFLLDFCLCKSLLHVNQSLLPLLLRVLQEKTQECILRVDDNLEISLETVVELLKLDKLNLRSELDLIKFIDHWAMAQINKKEENLELEDELEIRKLLEPKILPLIRFLTLRENEFIYICENYNWLTRDEKKQIKKLISPDASSVVSGPDNFPTYFSSSRENRGGIDVRRPPVLYSPYSPYSMFFHQD